MIELFKRLEMHFHEAEAVQTAQQNIAELILYVGTSSTLLGVVFG